MNNNANNHRRARNPGLHVNHRKRMKEKFLKQGLKGFSEHEIMEMLLYFALPQVDTNEIAHELINKGGSFIGVFDLPYEEMKKVSGIKDQAATFLKLIPEIARYYFVQEALLAASPRMTYEEMADVCVKSFIGAQKEALLCMIFDSKMRLLHVGIIAEGSFSAVAASFRDIAENIIKMGGASVVFAHNHPSSSSEPSPEDVDSTRRILSLLYNFEIELIEHFVVSGDTYNGILKMLKGKEDTFYRKYNL